MAAANSKTAAGTAKTSPKTETTKAPDTSAPATDEQQAADAASEGHTTGATAEATTLDSDTTKPSVTVPGDGPADTTDPTETAHSVTPAPGAEAIAAGTVNAVVPGKPVAPAAAPTSGGKSKARVEKYNATKPNGDVVTVTHNLDTGETSVSE